MDHPYHVTKLPNGAQIACVEMPHMRSTTVGFWVGVGGRHETARQSGMSHFIEHLLFKGTRQRSAKKITQAVEGLGGYLNAFTTEDHTCYYAKAGARHLPTLCDVLGDMFLDSQFAPLEIEREREVIREEILMYRDHPAQHAQELLTATMWPRHPLGRPLTGSVETISRFERGELLDFQREHYNGSTTIVTVAGPVTHADAVKTLRPWVSKIPIGKTPSFLGCRLRNGPARVSLFTQETEQTNLAMGFHAFGRNDERRFALKLLSVILGENMSSRLFQKLRERHGFCYSVHTCMVMLEDTGSLHISAGLDPGNLERALKMILRELESICHRAPSRGELKNAQDYTIGQTFMGLESTSNQVMWMGENLLAYGRIHDPAEIEQKILGVTPQEVQQVACHCLSRAKLGLALVGPMKDPTAIKALVQ